jgi:AraC-like DNA-binding protein
MRLLYKEEHLTCAHYDNANKPRIEIQQICHEQSLSGRSHQCAIVFVLEGSATYKLRGVVMSELDKGQIVLITPGKHFSISTNNSAKLLIIQLTDVTSLCECFPIEKLLNFKEEGEQTGTTLLEINFAVSTFVAGLTESIEQGLRCRYYLALKTKELFYLFRAYYSKEQLARFLREILYTDAHFRYFVEKSYQEVSSVREFAKLMGMKQALFEKKFKDVFNAPPYKWFIEQKTKAIHHALCHSNTPLKELSVHFGFFSKSSFSDFCKKNLGLPPGQIRKNVGICVDDE